MTARYVARLAIACALGASVCIAVGGCEPGDEKGAQPAAPLADVGAEPGRPVLDFLSGAEPGRPVLDFLSAPTFAHARLEYCEERLAHWSRGRAYEKLMIAEKILPQIASVEPVEGAAPHRGAGNDLSRVAGRAKWCLERLLGVTLPDVRPDSSPEEIQKLDDQAARLVEAYRNGIMAAAADRPLSAAALEELRRKYRGKVVPDGTNEAWKCPAAMEALLGEWPPIGRKYEDLVNIIGVKGEESLVFPKEGVLYRLDTGEHFGVDYLFIVRDGIICSVRRSVFS